jgi:hypothetical protein
VKQAIVKAAGFYARHLASQVSSLTQALAKALRLLSQRVDQLEQESSRAGSDALLALRPLLSQQSASPPTTGWEDVILASLQGADGRILHAEAGRGQLVSVLVEAGLDAYGVEPDEDRALLASDLVPDIRVQGGLSHLRTLPGQSLGGLVLSGWVERLSPGKVIELVDLAASCLTPGGTLIVVSTHPTAWASEASPLLADLAEGHPLRPETWQALLAFRGFIVREIRFTEREDRLDELPGDDKSADLVRANFARLNAVLFGPRAYAVVAQLPLSEHGW